MMRASLFFFFIINFEHGVKSFVARNYSCIQVAVKHFDGLKVVLFLGIKMQSTKHKSSLKFSFFSVSRGAYIESNLNFYCFRVKDVANPTQFPRSAVFY